jgi:hypothetical protein
MKKSRQEVEGRIREAVTEVEKEKLTYETRLTQMNEEDQARIKSLEQRLVSALAGGSEFELLLVVRMEQIFKISQEFSRHVEANQSAVEMKDAENKVR